MHAICPARCRVGKGQLPERSVGVKEAGGTKTTQINARMAAADHDRQGQTALRLLNGVSLYSSVGVGTNSIFGGPNVT